MLRLKSLHVSGLLGRFEHHIEFPTEWEFVIIHGPNGIGKTKLLELVSAVAAGRLQSLFLIPFATARLTFTEETSLHLARTSQLSLPDVGRDLPLASLNVDVTHRGEADSFRVERAAADAAESDLRLLEREFPVERMTRHEWYDYSTEETLTTSEVLARYLGGSPPDENHPIFSDFVQDVSVHLIETQRLITLAAGPRRPGPQRRWERRTVVTYGQDLVRRLREALAENSQTSQELDRSFPRRVMDQAPPVHVTDQEIHERYQQQSDLRDRLAEIALLDTSAEVPLPGRALEDWERRVLWTYLEDTEKKLATFAQLLDRVRLMRDIVNSRFLFKELQIDRGRGFKFVTESGDELGADSLSSGEQHELVLLYDLLFNVDAGSTVLIDEPEISLHISWQQKFLDDIVQIADVADLRFVIATHSPQIVNKWWDRTESLFGHA